MPSSKSRSSKPDQAARADKHKLYLKSVQEPGAEVDFFHRTYRRLFGRPPRVLREDFCGTAAICYEWVRGHKDRIAVGVDLDPEPLTWGRTHLAKRLTEQELRRVNLLQQDVRTVNHTRADVVAAENFSYWVFRTRQELREYFSAAHANLGRRGLFVLDAMGGPQSMEEGRKDKKKYGRFIYVWEQEKFDPISHHCRFHIHFRFKDGSRLRRAFTYDWRMWTIPEVCELLLEAGFDAADVYWEGTEEKTGEGNGIFRKRKSASNEPAWIAYVVGVKGK